MDLNLTQRYLVEECAEDYQAGRIGRRELLKRALLVTRNVALAAAVLRQAGVGLPGAATAVAAAQPIAATVPTPVLQTGDGPGERTLPPSAVSTAPVVAPDDPDIVAQTVTFPGDAGDLFGYLAYPLADGQYPALILNHDNVGLAEPNLDIARRFAKEGYVALVVDLASRAGGTAAVVASGKQILAAIGPLTDADRLSDMTAGVEYLKQQPFVNAAIGFGTIGFCFGGNQTWLLAFGNPDIRVAVPYYGMVNVNSIAAPAPASLAFFGQDDTRLAAQAPDIDAAMLAANAVCDIVIYPGAGHAFFFNLDDRYRPDAAQDAWRRTMAWFSQYLQ